MGGVAFRGASENSRDGAEFEREGIDDGVGWLVDAELATDGFVAASVEGVTGALSAAEFCAVSCDGGVTDFLLRKRVAAPKSVATITTSMAAVFQ